MDTDLATFFKNKKILITGGLGFLGSNLAHNLVALDARVTIVDNLNPLYGGNYSNIKGIEKDVNLIINDVRNIEVLKPVIKTIDIIFHFAAQVSYIDSLTFPNEDLSLNAQSTLFILEECRKNNPIAKIIFSSSRMVLGKIVGNIMTEDVIPNPLSLYGIHKLASERYLAMYYRDFHIPSVVLRITNPYGIRQQIKHSKYSLVGWFVRQAMDNKEISIYGEGRQLRDYIYADDIVQAFLRCAAADESVGEVINIGSGVSTEFRKMVEAVIEAVGYGNVKYIPWPKDYENLETGDVKTDISKLKKITNWNPEITLKDGIDKTYQFYKENYKYYIG
jgi:UDP-glucose 4-epimerase